MEKMKKSEKQTAPFGKISVPSAIGILIMFFVLLAVTYLCISKSSTVGTDEILSVLYSNRKEVAEKVLDQLQNLEKFEYCAEKKYCVCLAKPFELKGSEKLTLLNARLAVVDDESKFRLFPNPYEVYAETTELFLFKETVRYKWECSAFRIFRISDCKGIPLQEGEILFKKSKKDGYWRLFLPDGSIKISDQKATMIRYVPQIYESFRGFKAWIFKRYSTEIEELEKEIEKICSAQKCSFDEKENPTAQVLVEKIIDYAVENFPDVFIYPYERTFFRLKGTEEYVAKNELVDVE